MLDRGELEQAVAALERALALNPLCGAARERLAEARHRLDVEIDPHPGPGSSQDAVCPAPSPGTGTRIIARVVAVEGRCPAPDSCFPGKEFLIQGSSIAPDLCLKGQMGVAPLAKGIQGGPPVKDREWICAGPDHTAVFRLAASWDEVL